ncbi:MAG TPA: pyroglutamyl-peptidase I [Xanthobacteraceae bacterium]|jgi:pyroglutamyl-peptidase
MRVLLTAFGPFPGAPFNPSAKLVQTLARRRRPALANVDLSTHVFATSYESVNRDLPKLLAQKPDIVLMFGLAGRTRQMRIETRARNAVSVLFPDASRYRPRRGVIVPGGPRSFKGAAPFVRLLHAARKGAIPVRLSRDPGRYLCNYLYWRGLERAHNSRPLIQFIHIPSIGCTARPRRKNAQRSLTLERLASASENVLIALVAANHHRKSSLESAGGSRQRKATVGEAQNHRYASVMPKKSKAPTHDAPLRF